MTCRLLGSGGGRGVWTIPGVGDEVAVLVPAGQTDWMPIIVAVLASGALPDGVAPGVTVIADSQVLIHDGDGGAAALPTLAEFKAHTHPTGVGPSGTPTVVITGTTVGKMK